MINIFQVDKRCPILTKKFSILFSVLTKIIQLSEGKKQNKTISKPDRVKYFKHVRLSLPNKPRG